MEYRLFDVATGSELAKCSTVLVSFDYHQQITIPIPDDWRKQINSFEDLEN
jgi:acyl-CoA thioesterase FadM